MRKQSARASLLIEHIRAACMRSTRLCNLRLPAAALLSLGSLSPVFAGPSGGVVVAGQGTISTPVAGTTVIEQASPHLQVDWRSFDVAVGERVQFRQPSSAAVALNRILDHNPSQILGSLEANGKVVLVNPNGLVFGPSARINVGSLVASSLEVVGFDATSGRFSFGDVSGRAGAVINQGQIGAAPGGSVTLLGGQVSNTGSIIADFGTVNLAAGRTATIDLAGDGLLRLEVDAELVTNAGGAAAAVDNAGNIQANGGRVLLTAQALDGVFANLVNNDGTVRANRIDHSGGTIRLVGAGGTVRSSGTLDASAGDALSDGGRVEVLGERVGLFGEAVVDVSGARHGGTALIGGDYQGNNPQVPNAARTYVGANARIAADAGAHGDGGRIIVWSDEVTRFDGHLSARGGTSSGDGGFAEISGKQSLILTGTADLNAPHGGRGTLLLDPEWIRIIDSDLAPPAADDGEYEFEEDEYVSAVVGNRAIERLLENGNVVLQASMDIIQDADAHIDVSGVEGATGRALTLEAGRDITLNGNITLREGALTLHAVQDITLAGTVTTGGGVTLEAGRTIDMQGGTILAGSSAVDLEADEEITLGLITTSGDVTLAAGGAITAGSGSEIRGDTLMITGASIGSDAARLNTSVEVLSATASTGGIYITEQDGLRLQNLRADAGDVRITSTAGDIEVGEIDAVNVALDAAAGAIRDDDNDATRISASGGIALSAHTGIGTVADFSADDDAAVGSALGVSTSGTLSAEVASATGQIHLDIAGAPLVGAGALRLGDGSASAGTIVLRSGGDLNLGGLSAGALAIGSANTTRVGLRSGGVLTLPAGGLAYHAPAQLLVRGATDVVGAGATRTLSFAARALDFRSGAQGGATTLNTTVGRLDALIGNGQDLIVNQTGHLMLGTLSAAGGNIRLTASGAGSGIDLTGVVDAGTVTLEAGGAITAGGGSEIRGNTLMITGASIGSDAARLNTDVATLNATATSGGVYVTEANALALTASATGGRVDVRTTGALAVGSVSGAGITLEAGGAGSGIAVTGVIDGGDGDVTLEAGGAITAGVGSQIRGDTLTITGASIGSDATPLNTSVEVLSATASTGGIYITEQDGLRLQNLQANAGDVRMASTTGDIVVGEIDAVNVTLDAAAGAIRDDDNDATRISASGGIALSAHTAIGTVADFSADDDAAVGAALGVSTSGTLSAEVASATGQIHLDIAGTPALGAGALRLGGGSASAGTIVLRSGGDLDLSGLAPGVIALGSGNTTRVGLRSGGVLTLPAGGLTDHAPAQLLVSGMTDVVGPGATRTLPFAVGALDFRSGAQGGATTLVTSVGRLDAVVGNGQDLIVDQTGDLMLGTLSAAGGNIRLTTSGAVTDDGDDDTRIVADGASLSAAALGTASRALDTDVTTLEATASSGGIFVRERNALNLTAQASGGAVDVRTRNGSLVVANARGEGVTLVAGGAGSTLTLDGVVDAGSGNVALTAGTASARGAIVGRANHHITGNALTATGSSIGTSGARLATTVTSLHATSTAGGIHVTETNALNLTAQASGGVVDVQTDNGSLVVAGARGEGVILAAGGAGSAIRLDGVVDAGSGNVSLTAGTAASRGAILAGAGNRISARSLNATASAIGAQAARLNTDVESLNASALNGGIFVTEANSLSLTANATGIVDVRTTQGALTVSGVSGAGVTLSAGGAGSAMTLAGEVDGGAGDVRLTAGGALSADVNGHVRGNTLTVAASRVGAGDAPLATTVAALDATSSNGGIHVLETDGLRLAARATGGMVDVRTANGALSVGTVSGAGVRLAAGGAGQGITLDGVVDAGAGEAALTAGTPDRPGIIAGSAGHRIVAGALVARGAAIGASGSALQTDVDTLTAHASEGGVFVEEHDGLALLDVGARDDVVVSATNGDLIVHAVTAGRAASLSAGAGHITDDGDDATRLAAGELTLLARAIGAPGGAGTGLDSAARLDIEATTLQATATHGGLFIDEADGLADIRLAAAGDIELLTRTGDLHLRSVSAGDTLLLAAGGNLYALPDAGALTARAAELRAGTSDPSAGQIGTSAKPIELELGAGDTLRLYVPHTIDPNDPNRAPFTLPSAGVSTVLHRFHSPSVPAAQAGYGRFQGFDELNFTSPAETMLRSLQSQTGTVQSVLDIDWASFDPNVSLFGTLEPAVCLPSDQRDEEESTPEC